jgi:hypothetical protein
MTIPNLREVPWREPWQAISDAYAQNATKELQRETCHGHVLHGKEVTAVGNRKDCDDVLFYLGHVSPKFAVVHLTYQKESRPEWPSTSLYDSIEDWIEKCMNPDAADYSS